MKKALMIWMCSCLAAWAQPVHATESDANLNSMIRHHIAQTYHSLDFSEADTLNYIVFAKAYYGYMNMYNEGMLNMDKRILTVCDFTLSANEKRIWVIDLYKRKVLLNTYVSHGQASGKEYAQIFSNKPGSHKSSIGFYITAETYNGKHGYSLRLWGMDKGFNSAAYNRDIVVHGADYVSPEFISRNKCLGRSWGCPAVNSKLSTQLINTIKDNTCLYIHYPDSRYLSKSYWLNKKVAELPEAEGLLAQRIIYKDTIIKYEMGPIMHKVVRTVGRFKFPLH